MLPASAVLPLRRPFKQARMTRRLFCLVVACVLLNACTKAADERAVAASRSTGGIARHPSTIPHTLRIGDTLDITSLNPYLAAFASLSYMSSMTMAYLVRYGPDSRPMPELATEVPSQQNHLISRDGKTITWHLRKGVRWSDGAAFDADDLVFSTRAVLNPQNNVIGRDGFDLISKIDEPDKYTVIYHLRRAYSAFLPTFFGSAGANPCILPKHLLGTLANINNADYNSRPVGIGPFRYVEWVRGDHVALEANPNYWRGTPKLKKIIYKFIPDRNTLLTQIETGEVDLWPLVGLGYYSRVTARPTIKTVHWPGYFYDHLDFNLTRPIFHEKAVREALRYAIDRPTISAKTQHDLGLVQDAMITPASPLFTALPRTAFDPRKANALLDAAGWHRSADGIRAKNGQRLAFDLALSTGQPDDDQAVELMRVTWQSIGAQVNVQHYAPTVMFGPYQQGGIMYAGKFDMIFFAWQMTPDGDLSATHGCNQMPPAGQNDVHYCNPRTQALLDAAKAAYDEAGRRRILAAAQRQIIADVPEIVLWIRGDVFSYNADLTGWHPNKITPFDDMLGVDI